MPWASWTRRIAAPTSSPRTRASGTASGATTVTWTSRARSDAAASSPMKLAPITTARRPAVAAAAIARLSASERRVWTWARSAPSSGSRIGAAPVGDQERAVRQGAAAGADHARRRIDGLGGRVDDLDPERAQRVRGAEEDPLLGRGAGEVVLRQVGAIDRVGALGADQRDRARVAVLAQGLDAGHAGGAAADDDDRRRRAGRGRGGRRRALRADPDPAAGDLDVPARDRRQRRAAGRAGGEVEAGVVPRAPDRAAGDQALGQRSAVVGAGRADRVDAGAVAHQHDGLVADPAEHRRAVAQLALGDALGQVRSGQLDVTTHRRLHRGTVPPPGRTGKPRRPTNRPRGRRLSARCGSERGTRSRYAAQIALSAVRAVAAGGRRRRRTGRSCPG